MTTPKKVRRQNRGREASKALLMAAAEKLFVEHGFNGVTTRMIAQKSGINLGLITRYFKNKQGLFQATIEDGLGNRSLVPLPYPACDTLEAESLAFADYRFNAQANIIDRVHIISGHFFSDSKFTKKVRDKGLLELHPNFEERLIPHFKNLGITDLVEIRRFGNCIENNISVAVLFGLIIRGQKREYAHQELQIFVKNYCRVLTHCPPLTK